MNTAQLGLTGKGSFTDMSGERGDGEAEGRSEGVGKRDERRQRNFLQVIQLRIYRRLRL